MIAIFSVRFVVFVFELVKLSFIVLATRILVDKLADRIVKRQVALVAGTGKRLTRQVGGDVENLQKSSTS